MGLHVGWIDIYEVWSKSIETEALEFEIFSLNEDVHTTEQLIYI